MTPHSSKATLMQNYIHDLLTQFVKKIVFMIEKSLYTFWVFLLQEYDLPK